VLIPNGIYNGHHPRDPVSIGIIPISDHMPNPRPGPIYRIAIPAITLSILSMLPMFVHIVLGVVAISFTPQIIAS
jgi:hypothetical protein